MKTASPSDDLRRIIKRELSGESRQAALVFLASLDVALNTAHEEWAAANARAERAESRKWRHG